MMHWNKKKHAEDAAMHLMCIILISAAIQLFYNALFMNWMNSFWLARKTVNELQLTGNCYEFLMQVFFSTFANRCGSISKNCIRYAMAKLRHFLSFLFCPLFNTTQPSWWFNSTNDFVLIFCIKTSSLFMPFLAFGKPHSMCFFFLHFFIFACETCESSVKIGKKHC